MADILEYKCPCCGGKIEFDSSIQKMKCPYCETEFDMETLKQYDQSLNEDMPDDMNWGNQAGEEWQTGETDDMAVYVCKSCGGEIVGDKNMGATNCPFCDNPVVIMGKFSGDLKPDMIIPFKLDKKAAKAGLQEHFKGKTLLPKVFTTENHIDEIKGVYVPFWLFCADADAQIRFKAKKIREWDSGKTHYTETSYYSVSRTGDISFDNVPVDGSSKMPDDLMESLEPFDHSQAVDFQTAYFAGYLADRYDVTAEESIERANQRIRKSTVDEFEKTVTGYDHVNLENANIQLSNGKTSYALYPVWLLNTTWRDKKYTFAMNGQTGKFVGDLPMDKGKFFLHLFLTLIIIAAVVYGVGLLLKEQWIWPAVIASVLVTLFRMITLRGQLKSVSFRDSAASYIRNNSFKVRERNDLFLYKEVESETRNDD